MKNIEVETSREKLINGPIAKTLFKMALPAVWGFLAVIAIELTDTIFIGWLGIKQLAAISFCFPVIMGVYSIAIGLEIGVTSIIARTIGENDLLKVKRLATDSLILGILIFFAVSLIGIYTLNPLFETIGAGKDLLPFITDYMFIWYLGIIFVIMPMISDGIIRATGDTLLPSIVMTVTAVIHVILDPIFIFGLFGFPRLEIQGAAIATVISHAIAVFISFYILKFKKDILALTLPKVKEFIDSCKKVLQVGLPATFNELIIPFSLGIVTFLISLCGYEAVAGFGVASRLELFLMTGIISLAIVIGPFVGQNWMAEKRQRVVKAINLGFIFSITMNILIALCLLLFSKQIASLFNDNVNVIYITAFYISLVPVSYGFDGVRILSMATFNALGKPLFASAIIVTKTLCFYLPLTYTGYVFWGYKGIFCAIFLANILSGIISYALINFKILKKQKVEISIE